MFESTGAGYTLRITMEGEGRPEAILLTVQKYIENASFKSQHSPNSSQVTITLPTETTTTCKFPHMFSELSNSRDALGIKTIGLSLPTMDQVFMKYAVKIVALRSKNMQSGRNTNFSCSACSIGLEN